MQEVGNKFFKSAAVAAMLLSFAVLPVSAAVRCETQYGGGQVCVRTGSLQVNKQVKEKSSGAWMDNLVHVSGDQYFKPGEAVEYRILVKNVGDAKLDKVTFTDSFPSQIDLTEGNLNQEFSLDQGQEKEIILKGKVKNADQLTGMTTNCDVRNEAKAVAGDQSDQDNARVCVQKEGQATKTLPQAGPQDWYLLLGLSILASTTGFYLLKSRYARI